MLKCKLDLEQSKTVYDKCKQHIQVKQCYNNVFGVVMEYISTFRSGKWKVAYGYAEVMAGVYCRHCFILDESGKVIDPTIYAQREQRNRSYYVMTVFDDVDVYMAAVEDADFMPSLDKYLRERDRVAQQWAYENSIVFIG